MNAISYLLPLVGVFFSLIVFYLLFFLSRGGQQYSNRLLALLIIGLGGYTGLQLWPHAAPFRAALGRNRLGEWLYFGLTPFSSLYIRSVLRSQTSFYKKDGWLFLPVAAGCIISGLLVNDWMIRVALAGFFLSFQWRLLIRLPKRAWPAVPVPKTTRSWLFLFSGMMTVLLLSPMLEVFPGGRAAEALVFTSFCSYLLFKPILLFGIMDSRLAAAMAAEMTPEPASPGPGPLLVKPLFSDTLLQDHMTRINTHVRDGQVFKRKALTLIALAGELSLPQHRLSYILKHGYRQQFNDFINLHRVNYIRERMTNGKEWKMMTLEAIAMDAGFASRSTFFTVFKKHTGQTPAEFARELDKEEKLAS